MSEDSSDMRVVGRFVDHGAALSFRELCARVLEEEPERRRNDGDSEHLDRRRGRVEKREHVELDRDSLHSLLHDLVCVVSALVARMKSAPTPDASYDLATVLEASRTRLAQQLG